MPFSDLLGHAAAVFGGLLLVLFAPIAFVLLRMYRRAPTPARAVSHHEIVVLLPKTAEHSPVAPPPVGPPHGPPWYQQRPFPATLESAAVASPPSNRRPALPVIDCDAETTVRDRPVAPRADNDPATCDLAFEPTVAAFPRDLPGPPLPSSCVLPPPTPRRTPPPPRPPSIWGRHQAPLDPNQTAQLTPISPITEPIHPPTTRISRRHSP
jgi:hypothetical protein